MWLTHGNQAVPSERQKTLVRDLVAAVKAGASESFNVFLVHGGKGGVRFENQVENRIHDFESDDFEALHAMGLIQLRRHCGMGTFHGKLLLAATEAVKHDFRLRAPGDRPVTPLCL